VRRSARRSVADWLTADRGAGMSIDRFAALLYGIGEAAGYLAIPPSTLTTWAYGYERRRDGARTASAKPIVTAVRPERPGDAAMPFIGLAEAYVLAAFRHAGVSMQRIRPAIDVLARELRCGVRTSKPPPVHRWCRGPV
jgi:hypothetical protein